MTNASTWTCPGCSEIIELQFDACWKCGTERGASGLPNEPGAAHWVDESDDDLSQQPTKAVAALGWSVLAVVLFWPTGIMAVSYSILALVAEMHDKPDHFRSNCLRAANWRAASYGIGCLFLVISFFMLAVMVAGS